MIQGTDKGSIGKLNKAMYGLVQDSRQFYYKLSSFFIENGFLKCSSDPCLLFDGDVTIGLYVDDLLVIGVHEKVKLLVKKIENKFNIRKHVQVSEFIGCQFEWKENGKGVILHQQRISLKLIDSFGSEVASMKKFETPSKVGIGITQLTEDEETLEEDCWRSWVYRGLHWLILS